MKSQNDIKETWYSLPTGIRVWTTMYIWNLHRFRGSQLKFSNPCLFLGFNTLSSSCSLSTYLYTCKGIWQRETCLMTRFKKDFAPFRVFIYFDYWNCQQNIQKNSRVTLVYVLYGEPGSQTGGAPCRGIQGWEVRVEGSGGQRPAPARAAPPVTMRLGVMTLGVIMRGVRPPDSGGGCIWVSSASSFDSLQKKKPKIVNTE